MSLRGKTILILCATTILSTVLVALVWFSFFIRRVLEIERDESEDAARRVVALIDDDMHELDRLATDWAMWDDSYDYAATADSQYAASNFAEGLTFKGLGLSAFAFIGTEGRILYSYAASGEKTDEAVRSFAQAVVASGRYSGLALRDGSVDLVASRPVVRSDGSGKPRGEIVMARPLDEARLSRYVRLTGVSVSLELAAAGGTSNAAVAADAGRRASFPLRDLSGAVIARLVVETGGLPYSRAHPVAFLFTTIAFVCVGVGAASFFLLETGVFRRMRAVEAGLALVSLGRDPGARLPESGDDEFTELERVMNRTLDSLGAVIRQRDATLREVHHRVKNNLQVIASLLSLQAEAAREGEATTALLDVRRRVLSMALVHEELYVDSDLGSVNAARFLERVARASEPYESAVPIDVMVEDSSLSLDAWRAMPVGIIVSEAISRSCRSSFPEFGHRGISISVKSFEAGGLFIEECDGSIAPPDGGPDELGLRLARILAEQLEGSVEVGRAEAGGGRFVLIVPGGSGRLAGTAL